MKKNKLSPLYIAMEKHLKLAKMKEAFGKNLSKPLACQVLNDLQVRS